MSEPQPEMTLDQKLADAIHPADTQQMIIEADRALARLATES
jgi:hypothetical protein